MKDHPSLKYKAGLAFEHVQVDHAQQEIPKESKAQYQQIGKAQLHGVDIKEQRGKSPQPIVDVIKPQAEVFPFWSGTNQTQAPLKQNDE